MTISFSVKAQFYFEEETELNEPTKDGMIKYERGFTFNKGIYLSFEDFKTNNPIPFDNIDLRNGQPFDFNELMNEATKIKNKSVRIFINDSIIDSELHAIWGYSNGRNIYINSIEKGIFAEKQVPDTSYYGLLKHVDVARIVKLGSICHFTDFDFRNSKTLAKQMLISPNLPNRREDVDEYIIVMATGMIYNFNTFGLSMALENDDELLTKFTNESNGKKKDKIKEVLYRYLNLYNKKHPLFFPK